MRSASADAAAADRSGARRSRRRRHRLDRPAGARGTAALVDARAPSGGVPRDDSTDTRNAVDRRSTGQSAFFEWQSSPHGHDQTTAIAWAHRKPSIATASSASRCPYCPAKQQPKPPTRRRPDDKSGDRGPILSIKTSIRSGRSWLPRCSSNARGSLQGSGDPIDFVTASRSPVSVRPSAASSAAHGAPGPKVELIWRASIVPPAPRRRVHGTPRPPAGRSIPQSRRPKRSSGQATHLVTAFQGPSRTMASRLLRLPKSMTHQRCAGPASNLPAAPRRCCLRRGSGASPTSAIIWPLRPRAMPTVEIANVILHPRQGKRASAAAKATDPAEIRVSGVTSP